MEIIFATGNRHKLEEAQQILGDKYTLKTPADFGITEDIPETADTIEGNALQKVQYIWDKVHMPCFADDTGLFVDALDGAPGVRSARYAGEDKKAEDNVKKLLQEMDGHTDRSARFRCIVALMMDGQPKLFEGKVEGVITTAPSGNGGFGYDPIFAPEKYGNERTFSELTAQEKNEISHRGEAMRLLAEYLK
ncbi:MAG: RdgB/HAM1 family non-canonical purine NTP pyrophosphatase [Bacteroidales bacterium]|nr:RdgB/HAM1 family non-canonical purine NTP pyrophosphatase [Bacteroidales bacterium]